MIKIKNIRLESFRGFSDVSIEFRNQLTCIAGINGAGKTTILDALASNLSWIREMIMPVHHNGEYVKAEDKKKGSAFSAKIETDVEVNGVTKQIAVGFDSFPGMTIKFADQPEMQALYAEVEKYYSSNNLKENLPVIAYYPINRSDLEVDVSVESEKDLSDKYEIYLNCLNSITHYKDFFRWFRDREDRENAEMVARFKKKQSELGYEDIQLNSVRNAIKKLLPLFSEMTVDRKLMTVLVNKNEETLDFSKLSDGEKGIITLFGDIARRLSIANENLDNPLCGNGIILIDEIELHLHPSWQRKVCKALKETFPNCQFIITTHSPQVLGELKTEEIWLLNDFNVYRPDSSYGLTSNEILDEIMDVIDDDTSLSRDSEIAKKLNEVSTLVELEEFNAAKKVIEEIEKITGGEIHETVKYKTVIEMIGED